MDKLIFATGNEGKMKEVRMILADLGFEIQSMKEAGIDIDIVEDGQTSARRADAWYLRMTQDLRSIIWTRRLAYTARDS